MTFKFVYHPNQEISIEEAISQALGEASGIDDDANAQNRLAEISKALLEEITRKQAKINARHEAEESNLKKYLVDQTANLRELLSDRRQRLKDIIEHYWPGEYNPYAGDVADIKLLGHLLVQTVGANPHGSNPQSEEQVHHVGWKLSLQGDLNGFAIIVKERCKPCRGTGRTQDDVPGEAPFYGEACQYCKGLGVLVELLPSDSSGERFRETCAACGGLSRRFPVIPMLPHEMVDQDTGLFVCRVCNSPAAEDSREGIELNAAEDEPYLVDCKESQDNEKNARAYMVVWDHYQCAYNAFKHRESSDRNFAQLLLLTEAILGHEIPWGDIDGIGIMAWIERARQERSRLVAKSKSQVRRIEELQMIIEKIGKGTPE